LWTWPIYDFPSFRIYLLLLVCIHFTLYSFVNFTPLRHKLCSISIPKVMYSYLLMFWYHIKNRWQNIFIQPKIVWEQIIFYTFKFGVIQVIDLPWEIEYILPGEKIPNKWKVSAHYFHLNTSARKIKCVERFLSVIRHFYYWNN
jgi:hypothetical protein